MYPTYRTVPVHQLYRNRPNRLNLYQKWVKDLKAGKPVFGAYVKGKWFVAVPRLYSGSTFDLIEIPFQNMEKVNEPKH